MENEDCVEEGVVNVGELNDKLLGVNELWQINCLNRSDSSEVCVATSAKDVERNQNQDGFVENVP